MANNEYFPLGNSRAFTICFVHHFYSYTRQQNWKGFLALRTSSGKGEWRNIRIEVIYNVKDGRSNHSKLSGLQLPPMYKYTYQWLPYGTLL